MRDHLRHVMSLLDHTHLDLCDIFRLCQTCKGMYELLIQNHGPISVNVALDVEHMSTIFDAHNWNFDVSDLTYNVEVEHTRHIMSVLSKFDARYSIRGLQMNYCHSGHQARLISRGEAVCHQTFLFDQLRGFKSLKRLYISNVQISKESADAYLSTFAGSDISLVQCGMQIDDVLFATLSRIPDLMLLSLSGNAFCVDPASEFAFPKLKYFNCADCVSVDALLPVRMGIEEVLKEFCWDDNYIPDNHKHRLFTWLSTCQRMTRLHLRNTHLMQYDACDLSHSLVCLPNLTCVDVSNNEFKESVVSLIPLMPQLHQLFVSVMRGFHAQMTASWRIGRIDTPGDMLNLDDEFEFEDLQEDAE